jgi:hypothetical protein
MGSCAKGPETCYSPLHGVRFAPWVGTGTGNWEMENTKSAVSRRWIIVDMDFDTLWLYVPYLLLCLAIASIFISASIYIFYLA